MISNIPVISDMVSGVLSNTPIIGQVLTAIDIVWAFKYFYYGVDSSNIGFMALRVISILATLVTSSLVYKVEKKCIDNDIKLKIMLIISCAIVYMAFNYVISSVCIKIINAYISAGNTVGNLRIR
ncbi:hypothetical protein [Clostridium sp.]|uniref:hypothetical protein n=1 Tax=Clostridium sp. TaxID=1506 RepID=UPI0025C41A79|nr:hypothetical protein [Clostridium sp.]